MELVVNFSGGKDSIVMLHYLVNKHPNVKKHVVFADTGWEHTDAEKWCRNIVEEQFGLPLHVVKNPNDFFAMVRRRGMFPSPKNRQCTSDLKRNPIQKWVRQNVKDTIIINCLGLRAAESPARAKKARMVRNASQTNSRRTVWDWLPIHNWTDAQVYQYIADNGLPMHPVYQYLTRFSCQVCIYMSAHDLRQVHQYNRPAWDRIADIEKEIGFTFKPDGPLLDVTFPK